MPLVKIGYLNVTNKRFKFVYLYRCRLLVRGGAVLHLQCVW